MYCFRCHIYSTYTLYSETINFQNNIQNYVSCQNVLKFQLFQNFHNFYNFQKFPKISTFTKFYFIFSKNFAKGHNFQKIFNILKICKMCKMFHFFNKQFFHFFNIIKFQKFPTLSNFESFKFQQFVQNSEHFQDLFQKKFNFFFKNALFLAF